MLKADLLLLSGDMPQFFLSPLEPPTCLVEFGKSPSIKP